MNFKQRFNTSLTAVLSAIVGMLGFSACSDNEEVMYGTPYSTFQINGKVTDRQGKPVSGARVISRHNAGADGYNLYYGCDTTVTDVEGKYLIDGVTYDLSDKMRVVCQPHGKRLEPDSTEITVHYTPVTDPASTWHTSNGTATADFTLSDTEPEELEPIIK